MRRELTTVEELEEVVGPRPRGVMQKSITSLDEGCRQILTAAPIAGFGFRGVGGVPTTTLVGGTGGFTTVLSPTRIQFGTPAAPGAPTPGGGVGLVYLLPGIGETLRVNGTVSERTATAVTVEIEEVFVHCAKCVLRAGLWDRRPAPEGRPAPVATSGPPGAGRAAGPLDDAGVAAFLAASPFVVISSWNVDGSADSSPRGDGAGFVRILDGGTLAIPDRKGNRRTDTFHNLVGCDEVALAALLPGSDDLLHLHGTAAVTDDAELLATLALAGRPPTAALIVRVGDASIVPNGPLATSGLWAPSSLIERSQVPDLMALAARHFAANQGSGAAGRIARRLGDTAAGRGSNLVRRAVDRSYRSDLDREGYGHRGR